MKWFVAKNPKQLDICLKMLYAENITFIVSVCENDKRKIEYHITANTNEQTLELLKERYRIMIS